MDGPDLGADTLEEKEVQSTRSILREGAEAKRYHPAIGHTYL